MRRLVRIVLWGVTALLLVVLAGVVVLAVAFPRSEPAPDLHVASTPERVARGEYLFRHVTACADCHARHDRSLVGRPIRPGTLGQANPEEWTEGFFPPNITPAALGDWSDGEIARAVTEGIRKDGGALFPAMPYSTYRNLSRSDLEAIIAFVRTLPPRPVEHPRRPLGLPYSLIARISARPAERAQSPPAAGDPVAHGRYLVSVAGCAFCHTPQAGMGRLREDSLFAGGVAFEMGPWIARSANVTPDSATGIGDWSRERFVARFESMARYAASREDRPADQPVSPMPWVAYSGMTAEDLGAIYAFLRTVPPVRHEVARFVRAPVDE